MYITSILLVNCTDLTGLKVRFDSALFGINHNPLDKDYKNRLSNPLDGNLSNAFCYLSFDTTIIGRFFLQVTGHRPLFYQYRKYPKHL